MREGDPEKVGLVIATTKSTLTWTSDHEGESRVATVASPASHQSLELSSTSTTFVLVHPPRPLQLHPKWLLMFKWKVLQPPCSPSSSLTCPSLYVSSFYLTHLPSMSPSPHPCGTQHRNAKILVDKNDYCTDPSVSYEKIFINEAIQSQTDGYN